MNDKEKDYQLLLEKVSQVFGDDLDRLSETQEVVVDRLITNAISRSGGPGTVTIAQVQGVKEMLNNEFGMANAEAEEWAKRK